MVGGMLCKSDKLIIVIVIIIIKVTSPGRGLRRLHLEHRLLFIWIASGSVQLGRGHTIIVFWRNILL